MPTKAIAPMMMLIALLVGAGTVAAADNEEQKVLARAQRMLRQMSLERDAAQAESARLKAELEQLNRKLAGVKKSSEAALARSQESNVALDDNLQQTVKQLRQSETEKNQLQEMINGQAELIQSCESKNTELVRVNRELLDRYRKKGVFDALLQREPLTQLKRVEIENTVQEYQDRIDQVEFRGKAQTAAH